MPGDYGGDTAGGDWDVDLADFAKFQLHYSGPGTPATDALGLIAFDQDRDGDIDRDDYAAFVAAYTGPR